MSIQCVFEADGILIEFILDKYALRFNISEGFTFVLKMLIIEGNSFALQ